ncbi:unnamed protein product (macronuclear) [Paramecium tetraurelia]|uniref:Mitochondrial import inner membrane translocase subunit TIM50 n=1 Tax=Paramecium tetraurelia TaxID=5888 RepID=A0CXF1_PARTE|nr:uncharacterized protein GSPATT00011100001 [Paramecium tetraurelia]CAK75468.1 unnamed protein product [Paramecium tetraurelia]|eukprot:XP_001442865.1 hypothetical protein (macronuclear) [Paramecium tetraurelia strain d4-2]
MDSHVNLKPKISKQIQNDQKKQFYSDDDAEITPKRPMIAKPSKFSKGEAQQYQTDDSDNTPLKLSSPKSPKGQNKLSKFKQKENHIEKDSDIQFDSSENENKEKPQNRQNHQQADNYDIQEMSRQMELKYQTPKQAYQHPPIYKSNSTKLVITKNLNIKEHPFRHLVYGKNINQNDFLRFLQIVQSGLLYARNSLKAPSNIFLRSRYIRLKEPNQKKSKLLILDLDETLIHITITLQDDDEERFDLCFNVRPFCNEFLKEMSKYYNIHLFTASSELYANAIVNHLDPKRQYINEILCRNNCFETKNGFFIKDLRIITNRTLKDIVIVDNLPHSFGLQLENGIPILEYLDDQKDEELKLLQHYLIKLSKEDDVRLFNKQNLKLLDLVEYKLNI